MTGSALIAGIVRRPLLGLCPKTATKLSGMNRKALLLLLCARIGYTPPANVQH
ncbi:MAG: hypothetical protein ACRECX_09825 [Methyloceanibacter sp.]|uniref:hypothetical protein n=1 Tax=Methyloceanibacter sp. TaxID=1965321 RepID=UPI003D6D4418